jgi:glycosidase
MSGWWRDAVVYHLFPLGFCGSPRRNDFSSPAADRFGMVTDHLDQVRELGCNTLLLGPVFESSSHGYDTVDWYHIDRRLGGNDSFAAFAGDLHRRGMRLILDGVFNHVGRDFWAFEDLRRRGEASPYADWFAGVDFSGMSPFGDSFAYEGWEGTHDLVTLNLRNPRVKEHIFGAVRRMHDLYRIDGLRLDVAYSLDGDFIRELSSLCRSLDPDFLLLGELIHGDYSQWIQPGGLESVTNYECYKGIYSSHNDGNFFEIAYSLKRLFGEGGSCRGLGLCNFVDNHDVSRIVSILHEPRHSVTAHALLFTMPGVPSVYYGSEWGAEGLKQDGSDWNLRPAAESLQRRDKGTAERIRGLVHLRERSPALRYGSYEEVHVGHHQLAFSRKFEGEAVLVLVNSDDAPASVPLADPVLHLLSDTLTGEAAGGAPVVGAGNFRIFASM